MFGFINRTHHQQDNFPMNFKKLVSEYRDFPRKGILFRDLNPLYSNSQAFSRIIDILVEFIIPLKPDCIVGIEARGFIVGAALANVLNTRFIPIRKKGKLPGALKSVDYELEYGKDSLEVQSDLLSSFSRVIVVDDLLATGGSARAASTLLELCGSKVVGYAFIIELLEQKGRYKLKKEVPIISIIKY